ncbi:MAG: CocE/NonD family hydrolase [Timaviella obliquedivisa GSE-PSE-MK23-08B]|nr:CocE/NonD family hydrolase [Timaviella obliquedivisa GSE-PSE-MK23-08B]
METRDGVRLDADVYYPESLKQTLLEQTTHEFPVLLMRQPYGRAIASTVVYAHPTWYAAQGYIVVIQDVRGRGSSEGNFDLFAHEINDGFDTVHWAASLPQSNGQVGMYGFSYQGMTQLYAAAAHPPALKTLCPSMIGYDLYQDWAYEGGAFCYQLNLGWAIQLAAETARRQGDAEAYQALYTASCSLPLSDPVCPHSDLLQQFAPDSFYHDWLAHPEPDDYWRQLSPQAYMHHVDLPMLHIGGWFDAYMRGTLRFYKEMATRSSPQALWVGPWAHLPWGRKVGAIDYGLAANRGIDRLQIRWFDHFLKGKDTGLLDEPRVNLFEMGSNQWRTFEQFPAARTKSYFLVTTGLAGMDEREGKLVEMRAFKSLPAELPADTWVHDPWRPVPAIGGHGGFAVGGSDRTALDCRTDVLTYQTDPLTTDLSLAGELSVSLYCTADAPSFDLCAVLSEVKTDGVYNFSQGYRRIDSLQPQVEIILQPTCICIPKGSALRLSISAAFFPAYAVNSGTGKAAGRSRLIDARVITLTLQSRSEQPSQICLSLSEFDHSI